MWDNIDKLVTMVVIPIMIAYLEWRNRKRVAEAKKVAEEEKEEMDRKIAKKDVDTQAAVQALLRDKIVEKHAQFMREGAIDIYSRESIEKMYIEYKNLGGNGLVDKLMADLEELPLITPEGYLNK